MESTNTEKIIKEKEEDEEEEEEEEGEVYEVERIINHRIKNGKKQYLLQWKSFSDGEATWEDEENLNCPEMLEEYRVRRESLIELKLKQKIEQNYVKDHKEIQTKRPDIIISAFKEGGVLYYRVYCKNPTSYLSIPADELRKVRPDLICNFLENKIVVQSSH